MQKCGFISTCFLILSFIAISNLKAQSQEIAEFTVHAGELERQNTPVSASLDGIPLGLQTGHHLQLYEIVDGEEERVASQLDADGYDKTLRWILNGETPAGTKRNFILKREACNEEKAEKAVHFEDDGKSLTLGTTRPPRVGETPITLSCGAPEPTWLSGRAGSRIISLHYMWNH